MGPSSAARWYNCPGSLRVEHPKDDGPTDAADRGSLGHAMVEAWLTLTEIDAGWTDLFDSYSEEAQVVLSDQVDFVIAELVKLFDDGWQVIATEVQIQDDIVEEHGGTVDLVLTKGKELRVVDYKFGRVVVDVVKNCQITCYLNLAVQEYAESYHLTEFSGMIIQPAARLAEVYAWTAEDLEQARLAMIDVSVRDDLVAGDHCDDSYCPLRFHCTVRGNWMLEQAKKEFVTVEEVAGDDGLTVDEKIERLARMNKIGKAAAELQKGTSAALKALYNQGGDLSQQGLSIQKRTTWKWKADADPDAIAAKLDVPLSEISKLHTVKQIADFKSCDREALLDVGAFKTTSDTLITGKVDLYDLDEFEDLTAKF
jgi:hypothetical protein